MLTKEDEKLPLAWHVVGTLQHFHLVEDFVFVMLVWAQKVVVSDPESQVIISPFDVVKAVCMTVRSLIGAVESLDHLFKGAVLRRDSVIIGKSDDLCDLERKVFAEPFREFHSGKGIGAIAVSDELEFFRQLCNSQEGHTHGEDAGANAAVIGYLVADDGTGSRVHNEPDIGFDTADFDVGFISGEHISLFVGILINKGFDADSGALAVIGNLLVGDADVVEVFQGLRGFTQGEAKVDMECQTQGHDMGVMLREFEGRGVFGQGV